MNNRQQQEFADYMNRHTTVSAPMVDDVIDYIRNNLDPHEVFQTGQLEQWASENGFIRESDATYEAKMKPILEAGI